MRKTIITTIRTTTECARRKHYLMRSYLGVEGTVKAEAAARLASIRAARRKAIAKFAAVCRSCNLLQFAEAFP